MDGKVRSLLCVISSLWLVEGSNPGVQIRISQDAMNYASEVAIDQLNLQGKRLPDNHGSAHVKVGKVDYDVTNMVIGRFGKPSSQVMVKTGHSLTWTTSGGSIALHGDWHYKYKLGFIHFSDHGSFDISVYGLGFTVSVTLGDSSGHPTITAGGCSCQLNKVNIHLDGGASWLYNIFRGAIERWMKKKLQTLICDKATDAINSEARQALQKVPLKFYMGPYVLDYSLVAPPIFGNGFLESMHLGGVHWRGGSVPPIMAPVLPAVFSRKAMVAIWISDFLPNTLGYTTYKHGQLKRSFSPDMLPPDEKGALNTTCTSIKCIGMLIPQLGKRFPNSTVTMRLAASAPPTLQASPGSLVGHLNATVDNYVNLPSGKSKFAFKTSVVINCTGEVRVVHSDITAKITKVNTNVKVLHSNIGSIPSDPLTFFTNLAINADILPMINNITENGFKIPSISHVDFVNPQLMVVQNSLLLMTNVRYNPKSRDEI